MESDDRYYFRRACEEFAASIRAVTPASERRHRELAETFLGRVKTLDATRVKIMFDVWSRRSAAPPNRPDNDVAAEPAKPAGGKPPPRLDEGS